MSYLSNAAVNRLNIHTGLHSLAWNLSGNFLVVFLLSHGFPAKEVFLYLALILALRFVLRPVVLYLAPRIGSRRALYLGIGFFALQYVLLGYVNGVNHAFIAYCGVNVLTDIFYWTSYHSIFAFAGDEPHRGKQISVRDALETMTTIVAPLVGGMAIDYVGAKSTFAIAAVIEILSILPLLRVPDVPIAETRPHGTFRPVYQGALIFMTAGWVAAGFTFVWPVMLFRATGSSFTVFGGALALAGLLSAIGGLLLGHLIDVGRRRDTVLLMNGVFFVLALALRAGAGQGLATMLSITAVSSFLSIGYAPILMTAIYSMAAKAPCPLRFIFVTESTYDIGCVAACLVTAGLFSAGMIPGWAVAIAIPGAILQMVLLHVYYAKRSRIK